MPSPTYQQNKEHIYKWRETNRKEYNLIRKRFYYENKINIDNYTIYVYPSKYDEKFDFIISGSKIITKRKDSNKGWAQDLKIKLIDNKNKSEKILDIGNSENNIKEFFIF